MNDNNNENIYSKRLRAGKRRTYFFDVRTTKNSDYFVTLTESKKRYDGDGYDRHKIFLYKEDFNKFLEALTETINHVKTDLMPDFDFDAFNHDEDENNMEESHSNRADISNTIANMDDIAMESNSTSNEPEDTSAPISPTSYTANDETEEW